ncbi:MAG: hypothetical protein FJY85_02420 [Deltaproteobacteria bacterium]|nr:hypothetical protein [Deltaproteobacteria bacterium]
MPKLFVVDDDIIDVPLFVRRRGNSFVEEKVAPGSYEIYNTRKMPGTVTVTKEQNAPVVANPNPVNLERGQMTTVNLNDLVSGGVTPYTFSLQSPITGFSISGSVLTVNGNVASIGAGFAIVVVTGANGQSNTIRVNYEIKPTAVPVFTPFENSISVQNAGTFPDYTFTVGETTITLERTNA